MARDETLVFDLGMHTGQDTDFYLRKGYRVVGFEAEPGLVNFCQKRFAQAIEEGQLIVVAGAVAPRSMGDQITLLINENSVWNSIDTDWASQRGFSGSIEVNRVDIVDAFRAYGMPHYLKIDIEGGDRYVLESLKQVDVRPLYVSFESEKIDFENLLDELDLLYELGYRKFRAVQQQWVHRAPLTSTTLSGMTFHYQFERDASGAFGEDIPDRWCNYDAVVKQYRSIFKQYRWLGDHSLVRKLPGSMKALSAAGRLAGRPLPGWYDTHAMLDETWRSNTS